MPLVSERLDQTALVTGASAGIGLEIALVLAERGFDLVLVARRAEELSRLAKQIEREHAVRTRVYPRDLSSPDACEELESALGHDGIPVDLLVNNAGVMEVGAFHELPLPPLLQIVKLNAAVLTELSHRFLGPMLARGRGRILNVASLGAFQPVPSLAVYAATKAFVLSLTESLSEELKGSGVTVTTLCPGLTRTDMVDRAQEASALARMTPGFLISDSRKVAREGVDGCLSGRVVVVPGLPNRLQASLVGLYPRALVRAVAGLIGRRGM